MKNFTKTIALLLVATLCSITKTQAQTSIKMQIANTEKPADVHNYNLSSASIQILKPVDHQEIVADTIRSGYDNDEVRISISLKNAPDTFYYQLLEKSKNLFKGTITSKTEDGKNDVVYEFDQARVYTFSSQLSVDENYGRNYPQIELSVRKLKINGIEIEIFKQK